MILDDSQPPTRPPAPKRSLRSAWLILSALVVVAGGLAILGASPSRSVLRALGTAPAAYQSCAAPGTGMVAKWDGTQYTCVMDAPATILMAFCNGIATSLTTIHLAPAASGVTCALGTSTEMPVPGACIAQGLYVKAGAAGVNISSGVVKLFRNGSATALTCTLGTATTCTDTTHSQAFAAGDGYHVEVTTQLLEVLTDLRVAVKCN